MSTKTKRKRPGNSGRAPIEIEPSRLQNLYDRLIAGETWDDLALAVGCSDFGLKQCFRRAGFNLDIRGVRHRAIGKTRNILRDRKPDTLSALFLSKPLVRASQ